MEHIAIMKKSWKLIDRILTGKKTIESRWYMSRFPPWDRIKEGEVIYFKDSGKPVSAKAEVEKVLQFENYSEEQLKEILNSYSKEIFTNPETAFEWTKNKKYCILIFLKNPMRIEPFEINKNGYGNACAWISTNNVNDLKKP